MSVIKTEEAIKALAEIMEQYGSAYAFDIEGGYGCEYGDVSEDGEVVPACIVGQLIYRLDRPLFDEIVATSNSTLLGALRGKVEFEDEEFAQYMQVWQYEQDDGVSWGESYDRMPEKFK